jgi:hypothetical protein
VALKDSFACPDGGGDDDAGDDDTGDDDAGDDDAGDDDFGDDDTAGDDDAAAMDDCDCTHVPRRPGSVEALFAASLLGALGLIWRRRRRRP